MPTLRTFIAVEVASDVRSRACDLVERLRKTGVKATWTHPNNRHLTLKFLGDTEEGRVPEICSAVAAAARDHRPFRLQFVGAGAFPNCHRPRTVWLGVQEGEAAICALADRIETTLERLGVRREKRRFKPHLTLGRVRGSGPSQLDLGRQVEANAAFDAGVSRVEEVVVFASFLEPSGPTYQVMAHAPLEG
ncbi:MAG: RNA 2',3'-cyclic phosphodiesterase [Pirellulales bacterium]